MSKPVTYRVSCLNLTVHPHDDPQTYVNLIKTFERIKSVKVYGGNYGTIRYLHINEDEDQKKLFMTGTFVRFTDLDLNAGWYNEDTKADVDTEDEGRPILSKSLKPNRKEADFIFFPSSDCHKLFFISNDFSPGMTQKLLRALAKDSSVVKNFGDVNIEIITSSDAIDQILRLNSISSLLINVNMPNDDILSECEQEQIDRLSEQHIGKLTQQMRPLKGLELRPDDNTKALMRVATIHGNGYIEAKGEDPNTGEMKIVSSKDHPDIRSFEMEPGDSIPFSTRFLNCVKDWLASRR